MPKEYPTPKFEVDETGNRILEKNIPFSKSMLWDLQKTAYMQFGMQAWTNKGVPFYLTSNPLTARQYVNVVIGYIQDCLKSDAKTTIDLSAPLMIFDLGAGSGRYAYLFLKQILEALEQLGLQELRICYVITDIVKSNLDFCAAHPQMQSFIRNGQLDFAIYDNEKKEDLKLLHSRQTLNAPLKNPAIIIANYFFDTIPQELFKPIEGRLFQGNITLKIPGIFGQESAGIDPAWINKLTASFSYSPQHSNENDRSTPYLQVLNDYCEKFEGCPFLYPIGAFQAIDYFAKLSGQRLLLLAGDQGVCTEDQIREWGEPHIALHGSFSIAVSYHAIRSYFKYAGGDALLTSQSDPLFVVMTAVLGGKAADFPQMRFAFKNHLDAFEPSDYWKIASAFEQENFTPSLEHLLALLKLGNWDPVNFNAFFSAIRRQLPKATLRVQRQLADAIEAVWKNFYPVAPEEGAFVINLGVLLFEMRRYTDALAYFQRAQTLSGDSPLLQKNIAACEKAMKS